LIFRTNLLIFLSLPLLRAEASSPSRADAGDSITFSKMSASESDPSSRKSSGTVEGMAAFSSLTVIGSASLATPTSDCGDDSDSFGFVGFGAGVTLLGVKGAAAAALEMGAGVTVVAGGRVAGFGATICCGTIRGGETITCDAGTTCRKGVTPLKTNFKNYQKNNYN
jgi:hypothetical protein